MTHTSTEQPEALRLADALEKCSLNSLLSPLMELATELRRQHARIEELEAQLTATRPTQQGLEQVIKWPEARDVGRFGDMSPDAFIRVGLDADSDVYVSICDGNSVSDIEFCTPGGGGGRSSRTRMALIALMFAIEADNASHPSFDFWKRSMAAQARNKKGIEQ